MRKSEQRKRAEAFVAMHRGSDILVLPNAWDAISACVLVDAGFDAVATTSGGGIVTLTALTSTASTV